MLQRLPFCIDLIPLRPHDRRNLNYVIIECISEKKVPHRKRKRTVQKHPASTGPAQEEGGIESPPQVPAIDGRANMDHSQPKEGGEASLQITDSEGEGPVKKHNKRQSNGKNTTMYFDEL